MGFTQALASSVVIFFTPEECDVYRSRRLNNSALFGRASIRSNSVGIVMPLFRTEQEEDGMLAMNIALLRSETSDILLFAF